ncbi:hypothetical protein ABPG74_008137 [Tetrahymena malaccensis]
MITLNKRSVQSSAGIHSPVGQGPGIATPVSGNQAKKKTKKENTKKVGIHSRKLSENRLFYPQSNPIAQNGVISTAGLAVANFNQIPQSPSNYQHSNNFVGNNHANPIIMNMNQNANSPQSNHVVVNLTQQNNNQLNQQSYNYHSSNEHQQYLASNNSPFSHQQENDETGSSDSNQDIKNKLLSLLTQKNDCKKLIASKSSGNSLDFAIGEFGKRKKSPQNQINNNYNIGGIPNSHHHYHLGKKSPSKMKNLLYFQEKTANKSQIQNNSSTQFILSPKETKNIQGIFNQIRPSSKKEQNYMQLQHQNSFSPILSAVLKSKGLSPEKKDSLSPSKENLKNIIAAQKHINPAVSPTSLNSQQIQAQAESKAALKKKMSVPKTVNQDMFSYISKRNSSKERIINLFNSKHEALTDHNTRKSSALSKKHKSASPENNHQTHKNTKKAINTSQQQHQQQYLQGTKKSKPFFKKYRPPELDELHSTNTVSQSVPNSSKHMIQNTFNTPNNQNLNNNPNQSSQHLETKKFFFDHNLTPNSLLINSQTINQNTNQIQNINQNNANMVNISNTNLLSQINPNNISNSINYSYSARSNNQLNQPPQQQNNNTLYQNFINPYINTTSNQNKIITAAINYNLKNAENRLMKIQEDIYEGGEQSNHTAINEQLQKTFLRTSKLLSGYKARELKWEQEKRALVDEIKFLKNLLYTEQFDDLVINSQMSFFYNHFVCFALVICALCA